MLFIFQVIDCGAEEDMVVSFFKNTDQENMKIILDLPEKNAVPKNQIIKKLKPPEKVAQGQTLLYKFKL